MVHMRNEGGLDRGGSPVPLKGGFQGLESDSVLLMMVMRSSF